MNAHFLKERFLENLSLIGVQAGSGILLAVSGGPDSMAMLHLFFELKESLDLRLEVIHINHHLRNGEAEEDARFAQNHSKMLNLPFKLLHFKIFEFALKKRISIEMAGHRIRHHFLRRYAKIKRLDYIALAHTASDQAETVFLNALRGAGPRGLGGIPLKKDSFIRPLLCFSREEILKYVTEFGIPYRTDSSNANIEYQRNLVRNELFPLLEKKFSRKIQFNLARTAAIFQEEEKWLEDQILPHLEKRVRFLGYGVYELTAAPGEFPPALERRILRKFIQMVIKNLEGVSFDHIESIRKLLDKRTGKRFTLSDFVIERTTQGLALSRAFQKMSTVIPVNIPGEIIIEKLKVVFKTELVGVPIVEERVKIKETFDDKDHHQTKEQYGFLDFNLLSPPFFIRFRREGDWFFQPGIAGRKKLQDYFVNKKIPRLLRDKIPLFEANQEIVWIGGYAFSEKAMVTSRTTKIMKLSLSHV